MIYTTKYSSPIGELLLASENNQLVGLWIEGQKHYMANISQNTIQDDSLDVFIKTKDYLDKYFNGENPDLNNLNLNPKGSNFQKKVWSILKKIPYGETTTYGEIAREISDKMSAQAVGGAVGRNPISIIIPCHRVLGSDGSLTGYAGGIENKIKLLRLEKVKLSL